jgi:ribose transport system substrate-binding protein
MSSSDSPKAAHKRLYLVPTLSRAFDILDLLEAEKDPLSLETIYKRLKVPKTTLFRILKTLVHRGQVVQTQSGQYRLVSRPKKMRFGFAGQSSEMPFSEAVTASLIAAASSFGIDLLLLDNRYDAETAVRNADRFVEQRVDLVIEFQIEQNVAAVIADKISGAGIPLIAVDIPHPHATYFGADNYRVGYAAGELLAKHAIDHWKSKVNWVLGLDLEQAGPFGQTRTTGAFDGVRSHLPNLEVESFVRIDSRGLRDKANKGVADFLRRHPTDRRILISAHNDTVALGALEAVRELKREKHVAIVGQDCIPEAVEIISAAGSPLVGSISHEASSYGPNLIRLGVAILRGEPVPPYNYAEHKVITRTSLSRK